MAFFFVQDDQATFHQQRVVVIGEHTGQTAPALWCVAQSKLLGDASRDTTAFEISHCSLGNLQLLLVGMTGFFKHVIQCRLFFTLLGGPRPVLRTGIVFWHFHAELLGQVLHGFDKAHARVFHQKTNGIACFSAAKAVVELLGGAD